ncbi:MAG: sugar phosphate isomerase/epimerase family protein [Bryobacteraceae bacterium]
MKLKLGIVADEIARDFEKAVAVGKALGIARYEVRNLISGRIPMCLAEELRHVEETVRREEVAITAISPGLFKYTEDAAVFAREMREVYPRAAEIAHRWRLPGLIVFGFHKPGATEANAAEIASADPPAWIVEWLAAAGERATADGLLLMIEPEPICWADSARAAAELIRQAGSSALRINYDPGNVAWLENRDPLAEFDAAAALIANVHVKDLRPLERGAGNPEWVPAGEGMIDYRAHFRALRNAGYEGPVSLEPHMDGSAETVRRCRDACEREWGES